MPISKGTLVFKALERYKDEVLDLPLVYDIIRDIFQHILVCEDPRMFGRMRVTLPDLIALFVFNRTRERFSNRKAMKIIEKTPLREGDLERHFKQHLKHGMDTPMAWRFVEFTSSIHGGSRSLTRVHKDNAKLVLWITALEFLEKEVGSLFTE